MEVTDWVEQALLELLVVSGGPDKQHAARVKVLEELVEKVVRRCGDLAEDYAAIDLGDQSGEAQELCSGIKELLLKEFAVLV
jgi:hypothetical protein